LLGEEVDTQVAVLAGGRGGGDADDLARTALQDKEIAEADVVAGDGDSVGSVGRLGDRRWGRGAYSNVNLLPVYMIMMLVMVVMVMSRQAVGSTVEAVAEGVIVTIFIVVTHLV